jgi:hypothetical protein
MTYSTLCDLEDMNWVVLTAGAAEIYSRAATCGEWKDSGAQVTIEEVAGEFLVSDSLPR